MKGRVLLCMGLGRKLCAVQEEGCDAVGSRVVAPRFGGWWCLQAGHSDVVAAVGSRVPLALSEVPQSARLVARQPLGTKREHVRSAGSGERKGTQKRSGKVASFHDDGRGENEALLHAG